MPTKKFKTAAAKKPPAQPAAPSAAGFTEQEEQLFEACRTGDIKAVKKLIKEGVDVNAEYCNGTVGIQYAIDGRGDGNTVQNAHAIIQLLIDKGADVNKPGCSHNALHKAAMAGMTEIGALLLDHGAHINTAGMGGNTALHLAVQANKVDFVKMLIDRGASLTVKTIAGHSVIRAAADYGNCGEAVEALLTYPAESERRRNLLEAQKQAAAEATTVLGERIAVSKPLQLRKPADLPPSSGTV